MKEKTLEMVMPALPNWSQIDPKAMLSELEGKLALLRQSIERFVIGEEAIKSFSWSACHTIQELIQNVNDWWRPLSELYDVSSSALIREVIESAQKPWIEFYSWLYTHRPLFDAISKLRAQTSTLSPVANRVLDRYFLACKCQGIELAKEEQIALQADQLELAREELNFSNNLVDAAAAGAIWHLESESLEGLPQTLLSYAQEQAAREGKPGYKFALDDATVPSLLEYAKDRNLRARMHRAYTTRASDQAEGDLKRFDNAPAVEKILQLRQRIAQRLGYKNFALYALQERLLKTPEMIHSFLNELLAHIAPILAQEHAEFEQFALKAGALESIQPWDGAYYSRLLKQERYQIDVEEVRQYYPLSSVLKGLFALVEELFGVSCICDSEVVGWTPEVKFYRLVDKATQKVWGGVYFDLFARDQKQQGAWVSGLYASKRLPSGALRRPVGALHTNFMLGEGAKEPLLRHREIVTLFHEMGHMLQMLLTQVEEPSVSGLSGIPLDAVEIASQWLEEWAWNPEVLRAISCHVETQAPIPEKILALLIEARKHQAAYALARQTTFSLFDLALHESEKSLSQDDVLEMWRKVRAEHLPDHESLYSRMAMSFAHIFASIYPSGYYSYLWSEVLAIDLFLSIQEVASQTSLRAERLKALKEGLFAQGGSVDTNEQFRAYRGRDPKVEVVLARRGLV